MRTFGSTRSAVSMLAAVGLAAAVGLPPAASGVPVVSAGSVPVAAVPMGDGVRATREIQVQGARLVDGGRVLVAKVRWSEWLRAMPGPGHRYNWRLVGYNSAGDEVVAVSGTSSRRPVPGWVVLTRRLTASQARAMGRSDAVVLATSQQYDAPGGPAGVYEIGLAATLTVRSGTPLQGRDCRGIVLEPGAELYDCDLAGSSLRAADLSGANMRKVHLTSADLTRTILRKSVLYKADLSYTHMPWADLTGADLANANVGGAWMYETNFSSADLADGNLSGSTMIGVNLNGANLEGTTIRMTDLRSSTLLNASLTKADLRQSDLRNADLTGADLRKANARDANLTGADLTGVDLTNAQLSGATWTDGRVCVPPSVGVCTFAPSPPPQ